jgi:hypothetical protein
LCSFSRLYSFSLTFIDFDLTFFLSFFLCVHVSFFLLLLLLFYLNLSFFVSIWTLTKTRLTLFPVIHLLSFVSKPTLEKVFTIYKGFTFIATKRIFFHCELKYVSTVFPSWHFQFNSQK